MWGVSLFNILFDYRLNEFGVVPRTIDGLIGIPLMPFIHANFDHLLVNTLPAAFLGGLVAIHGGRKFLAATVFITLVGGTVLWLVGRDATHIGASGLIFGYFGYLIAMVWYTPNLGSVLIALLVAVTCGGILLGVLPFTPGVSWEGHLAGLVTGTFAARMMWKQGRAEQPARPDSSGPLALARSAATEN